MNYIYGFEIDSTDDILTLLAQNMQKRRLEKGLSRHALSEISGVPAPTIAKFEQQHTISLASFVTLAKTLGYTQDIKQLLADPIYHTMAELDQINQNKERKRGRRNEVGK